MIISPLQLAETCIIDSFEMLEAPQVPTHLVYGDKNQQIQANSKTIPHVPSPKPAPMYSSDWELLYMDDKLHMT